MGRIGSSKGWLSDWSQYVSGAPALYNSKEEKIG